MRLAKRIRGLPPRAFLCFALFLALCVVRLRGPFGCDTNSRSKEITLPLLPHAAPENKMWAGRAPLAPGESAFCFLGRGGAPGVRVGSYNTIRYQRDAAGEP